MVEIVPAILTNSADEFKKMIRQIEPYATRAHLDIADGIFVPNETISGYSELGLISTGLKFDVHLMVEHPIKEGHIQDFADAGASIITIHEECKDDIDESIRLIKDRGIKAGISIKPKTQLTKIKYYLDKVDMVLIMSVEPGYSGQSFMPEVLGKAKELRKLKPKLDIEIDGGINKETISAAANAGVNIFVAASAIFGKKDRKKAIADLRGAANG